MRHCAAYAFLLWCGSSWEVDAFSVRCGFAEEEDEGRWLNCAIRTRSQGPSETSRCFQLLTQTPKVDHYSLALRLAYPHHTIRVPFFTFCLPYLSYVTNFKQHSNYTPPWQWRLTEATAIFEPTASKTSVTLLHKTATPTDSRIIKWLWCCCWEEHKV